MRSINTPFLVHDNEYIGIDEVLHWRFEFIRRSNMNGQFCRHIFVNKSFFFFFTKCFIYSQHTKMYWDHFQQTPPISTYLVAFFVGEFYALKSHNIGVYTHRDYVNQTAYIAEESPKLLEAMENFTGVDYMMPKLDLLAIPDFAAGAMENWGLNTYR